MFHHTGKRITFLLFRHEFKTQDINNVDESDFTTVQMLGKVISRLEKKQVGGTTSQKRGEITLIVWTANAFPSFNIFKVTWNNFLLNSAPVRSEGLPTKQLGCPLSYFSVIFAFF